MKFDENTPPLTGDYDGEAVVLVSNVGGKRDKHFARNYATAKNLADSGRIEKIIVCSVGEGVRADDALQRSVGAGHPAVEVCRGVSCIRSTTTYISTTNEPGEAPEKPAKGRKRGGRTVATDGETVTTVDDGVAREWDADTLELAGQKYGDIETASYGEFHKAQEVREKQNECGVQGEGTSPPKTDG